MLTHPLASDSASLAASQYLAAVVGLLTNIIAARALGPSDYGTFALIMAYPTLLWSVAAVKSVSVTTRYLACFRTNRQDEDFGSICKLGYTLDFCSAMIALVLVSGTSWWVTWRVYDSPEICGLMVGYAASLPLSSLNGTSRAILSSLRRFRWLAILQIVDRGIMFILVVVLLIANFGVRGMVMATAMGQATSGIIMVIVAVYALHDEGFNGWWNASLKRMTARLKELVAFLGWNYVMVTLSGLVMQVPVVLFGRFGRPDEAGYYRLAMSITTIGSYMENALVWVAYPVLSARWERGEWKSLKLSLKNWTMWGGLPAGIVILLFIPFLPLGLPRVFGNPYKPMMLGTQFMLVSTAISTVFFWLQAIYYASARADILVKAYGLYAALVIGLTWICIPWWGFSGLALVVSVSKIVFTLLMVGALVWTGAALR